VKGPLLRGMWGPTRVKPFRSDQGETQKGSQGKQKTDNKGREKYGQGGRDGGKGGISKDQRFCLGKKWPNSPENKTHTYDRGWGGANAHGKKKGMRVHTSPCAGDKKTEGNKRMGQFLIQKKKREGGLLHRQEKAKKDKVQMGGMGGEAKRDVDCERDRFVQPEKSGKRSIARPGK